MLAELQVPGLVCSCAAAGSETLSIASQMMAFLRVYRGSIRLLLVLRFSDGFLFSVLMICCLAVSRAVLGLTSEHPIVAPSRIFGLRFRVSDSRLIIPSFRVPTLGVEVLGFRASGL